MTVITEYKNPKLAEDHIALWYAWVANDPTGEVPMTFDVDVRTLFLELHDEFQEDVAHTLFNLIGEMWKWHPTRDTETQWAELIRALNINREARHLPALNGVLDRGRREHHPMYYVIRAFIRVLFWLGCAVMVLGLIWVFFFVLKAITVAVTGGGW